MPPSRSRSRSNPTLNRQTRGSVRLPYPPKDPDCVMFPERTGNVLKKYHEEGTGKWKSGDRKETQVPWYFTEHSKTGKPVESSTAKERKRKHPTTSYQKKIRKYFRRSRSKSR